MILLCIIFWIAFAYTIHFVNKKEENGATKQSTQGYHILIILFLVFALIFTSLAVLNTGLYIVNCAQGEAHYDEFADSLKKVLSFHSDVEKVSVDNSGVVTIHLKNQTSYDYQDKLSATVSTIAHNCQFVRENQKIKVIFYYNGEYVRSFDKR